MSPAPSWWKWQGMLLPILILGLALRLAWALAVPVVPVSDSGMYDIFAREIAAGRGYAFPDGGATVYWPVGTPALYGFFYALFGAGHWVVAVPNLIMGGALIAGVHLLANRTFAPPVGTIAGAAIALWPSLIQFTTVLSSELPFLLFLTFALWVWKGDRPSAARVAWSSALLVAAAYMRPTALPLLLFLPLLALMRHRDGRTALIQIAIAGAVAVALIGPWALRNQAAVGAPVLISANLGANLWMGNNPRSEGRYMPLPPMGPMGEVDRDALLKRQAVTFITENPGEYLKLSAARVIQSFGRETIGVAWNAPSLDNETQVVLKIVSSAYWLTALALSLFGAMLFIRADPFRLLHPLIVIPVFFSALAIGIVGQDRYHMPAIPFVAIFAALALDWFRRGVSSRLATKPPIQSSALAKDTGETQSSSDRGTMSLG